MGRVVITTATVYLQRRYGYAVMNLYVRKWGNSAAVRIPAATLDAAGLRPDDAVEVREENGRIVIEKAHRSKLSLDELIDGITPENRHEESDWGPPVGKEFW